MYYNKGLFLNDEVVGTFVFTDYKITTENKKINGKDCYCLELYLNEILIFISSYNKEIKIEDNRIFIYTI